MNLGTRVQFPPPPLKAHLGEIPMGFVVALTSNLDERRTARFRLWVLFSGVSWVLWGDILGARVRRMDR